MERKRQPERDDEPAVTFELEGSPRTRNRSRVGAVGGAAVAGTGLISSGATPDSIDVFDDPEDPDDQSGEVPVTSFTELGDSGVDPEFPPIDFAAPVVEEVDGADNAYGASSSVGGGFTLDGPGLASDETYGASEAAVEAVPDPLDDDPGITVSIDDEPGIDTDTQDDLDLS